MTKTTNLRTKTGNTLAMISFLTSFGALFIFGVFIQKTPAPLVCDTLAGATILTWLAGVIILPRKADHRLIVVGILGLIAAILYVFYRI